MKRPLPLWIPGLLLTVGLAQMTFDTLGWRAGKAVAAATMLSPAPRVFSTSRGLETFTVVISLHWTDRAGQAHDLVLTPEIAQRLRGPYNRRNVYGAVLAYGPALLASDVGRGLFESVLRFALQGERPLLRELGIDPESVTGPLVLRWQPLHSQEALTEEYSIP